MLLGRFVSWWSIINHSWLLSFHFSFKDKGFIIPQKIKGQSIKRCTEIINGWRFSWVILIRTDFGKPEH